MNVLKRYMKYFGIGIIVSLIVVFINEPGYIGLVLISGTLGLFIGGGIEIMFTYFIDVRKSKISKLMASIYIGLYALLLPALLNYIFPPHVPIIEWIIRNKMFIIVYVPFVIVVSFLFNNYYTKLYSTSNQRLKEVQALNEVTSDEE